MTDIAEAVVFSEKDYRSYEPRIKPAYEHAGFQPLAGLVIGDTLFSFVGAGATHPKARRCQTTWFISIGYWEDKPRSQYWPTNHPKDVDHLTRLILASLLTGGSFDPVR